MAEFYKMHPAKWDNGTADLSLEQEAAYLRIVNAINKADEPCPANKYVMAGLFRCRPDKAMRLLQSIVDAEKVYIEDGKIYNERAMNDVRTRHELGVKRAFSGSAGGIQKQVNTVNALKDKEPTLANATPREEKRREEKKGTPKPPKGGSGIDPDEFEEWYDYYPRKVAKGSARRAFIKVREKVEQAELISAVRVYAAVVTGKDKEFIAHPATWLNGERWLDSDGVSNTSSQVSIERRVEVAKDWLSRNDDIPTWMDSMETAEALINEGYDYDRLRRAGFSLPPRGKVIEIAEALGA